VLMVAEGREKRKGGALLKGEGLRGLGGWGMGNGEW
jgi:hypothetical protein